MEFRLLENITRTGYTINMNILAIYNDESTEELIVKHKVYNPETKTVVEIRNELRGRIESIIRSRQANIDAQVDLIQKWNQLQNNLPIGQDFIVSEV